MLRLYSSDDFEVVLLLVPLLVLLVPPLVLPLVLLPASAFGLSLDASPEADEGLPSSSPLEPLEFPDLPEPRLSVTYQPLPLKITPTGCNTRRMGPCPQSRHSVSGSDITGCIFSNRSPQFLHWYS